MEENDDLQSQNDGPMTESRRPFYGEYAWAFDLLIDRPVAKECAVIIGWLVERGVVPGARLLDAGCGTGRYATELARRGYLVDGVDRAPDLIDVARRSAEERSGFLSFRTDDFLALPGRDYDAILCRGVLNDLVDDDARERAFSSFARALRLGGVLILDVREWESTKARKLREPLFRKSVDTDRGRLTFTSITKLDPENHQLLLSETHTLLNDSGERSSEYQFVMRCWTQGELYSSLERAGFGSVASFGAYDPAVNAGATDRLVVVADARRYFASDAGQLISTSSDD
jgi:SAM-dependent methyltransferase